MLPFITNRPGDSNARTDRAFVAGTRLKLLEMMLAGSGCYASYFVSHRSHVAASPIRFSYAEGALACASLQGEHP